MTDAIASARAGRDSDLADLMEELRIPSVSTLPDHREDCLRNAEWLRARLARLGMKTAVVDVMADGLPVVIGEWDGNPGKPHLTIYGHYDVQPPDPLDEWRTAPFEPEIRGGHIYARGSADNKGNHLATIKAIEHLFAVGQPPVNLRFILEGEEEISGESLPRYVRANASKLQTDSVLIWDGHFNEDGKPPLATTLRGLLYVELHARGAAVDLHSGVYGGAAPNPINTLALVIAGLKGRDGHVLIPGYYDDVRPPSGAELTRWEEEDPQYADELKRMSGVRVLEGEAGFLTREKTGSRPTLDVNGIVGGFTGAGKKTVIPARASAKVSMRLVPDQQWNTILASLERQVGVLTTPGVEVTTELLAAAPPVTCSTNHPAARALRGAYLEAFGTDVSLTRVGGSIPVAVDFQEAIGAPLVISGIAQADSSIHSPNEHLALDQYFRGIETMIHFVCRLASEDS